MRVLIAGGGTGGHIYPALAVADALRDIDPDAGILFVGARGRMEMQKVPQAGYRIEGLPIAGIQRSLDWRNLLVPFKLLASLWLSWRIIRRFRPDVALGVGGYASGPALRVAGWMGIPYILQEQNSFAGVTNRLLARKASKVCVAWPGMERFFASSKLVFTGNPLRKKIATHADRGEGLSSFGLDPSKRTILLLGGSLGARALNEAVMGHADWLEAHPEIQLIWQCGSVHEARCRDSRAAELPNVRLHAFLERMDLAYAAADLVIARAGALTIAELCQVGKAVILVPSPYVAEDHQTSNAMALVKENAALMVADKDVSKDLFPQAAQLLEDAVRLDALASAIRSKAMPQAAEAVARELLHTKPKKS